MEYVVYAWSVRYLKMSQRFSNVTSNIVTFLVVQAGKLSRHVVGHVFFRKIQTKFQIGTPEKFGTALIAVPGSTPASTILAQLFAKCSFAKVIGPLRQIWQELDMTKDMEMTSNLIKLVKLL